MFAAGQARADRKAGKSTLVVTRHCPVEMRQRSAWSIDQFALAAQLGGGYASTVHLAVCKATGIQVAIKVYHRVKLSQLNQYQVHREIRIHSCLDHKNVLQLFAAFEDGNGIYLVTEYASRGDVFGELDRRGGSMTEADAVRQVLGPFLSALEYLHTLNIIHRDIKPENLLFTATGVLKVADFGLSIDITQERPVTRVGTLDYMAPEVVICPDKCLPTDNKEKTHLHYTYLVDAWAVGVLAYELTVGRAPFDAAGNKQATIENILRKQPRFPAWISDSCRHFVCWSLTKDTAKRPGIQQLGEHPWIHLHAGVASRPRQIQAGRAVSFHNLSMYKAAAAAANHQPRHKLAEVPSFAEGDELFVSADGHSSGSGSPAIATAGRPSMPMDQGAAAAASDRPPVLKAGSNASSTQFGICSPSSNNSSTKPAVPGAAVAVSMVSSQPSPSAAVSPFAAAAAKAHKQWPTAGGAAATIAAAAAGGRPAVSVPSYTSSLMGLPVLGAAAHKLRAFVHRYQSANDVESLKAFMMQQPTEPSNACFEPGGRYYTGSSVKATPVAAAEGDQAQQQQSGAAANQQASKHAVLAHDSAASLSSSSSSSSSSSRPLNLPKSPSSNNSSSLQPPRRLQVLRLSPQPTGTGMPRSDSCKSFQGASTMHAGKQVGQYSNIGPLPMSTAALAVAASDAGSPMAVSPAVAQHSPVQNAFDSPMSPAARPTADASTSSCGCSSHANGVAMAGSVSSSNSWGYQQQCSQQQPHQAPQPPSPPCLGSKVAANASTFAPGCNQRKLAGVAASKALEQCPAAERTPSCTDLESLISICRPGQSAAGAAGQQQQHTVVSIVADCRVSAQGGTHQMGGDDANTCFGFLKSPTR